jgi:hypothetical protein
MSYSREETARFNGNFKTNEGRSYMVIGIIFSISGELLALKIPHCIDFEKNFEQDIRTP